MCRRLVIGVMFLGLSAMAQAALAEQATPAASLPPQANEARNQIQSALLGMISEMPDRSFLDNGIAAADVARAKSCSVQAIVADIPDAEAQHIVEQMFHDPPLVDDVVEKWVLSGFSKKGERRSQVVAQVQKLCPEFADALSR